ncbi:MAG: phage holin family protein [Clostridiales bacterium]|nr:phage holin family protein [Clostridiales bacterium]
MERIADILKLAAAAAGAAASYLWGPFDALILTLVAVVCIDYITGIVKAVILKELSSGVGFRGLLKKMFIFALVALATVIDGMIPAAKDAIRTAVIGFYVANEGISILENAGAIGLPMPKALKGALERLQEAGENAQE